MEEGVCDERIRGKVPLFKGQLVALLHQSQKISPANEIRILSHHSSCIDVQNKYPTHSTERDIEVGHHLSSEHIRYEVLDSLYSR